MNRFGWLCIGLLLIGVSQVGCGKKSGVDTSKLESSFQTAAPAPRSDVRKAVVATRDGNYSDAITQLRRIATKDNPTPEQQQAIKETIAAVQKRMADLADHATAEVPKTAGDLEKPPPK